MPQHLQLIVTVARGRLDHDAGDFNKIGLVASLYFFWMRMETIARELGSVSLADPP